MIESVIKKATKKENLTYEEARMTMTELMNGTATPVQASAYLVSMAMKGETIDEIAASAEGMRAAGTKLQTNRKVAEIVGTGGDGSDSFNISTTGLVCYCISRHSCCKARQSFCVIKIRCG